MLKLLTISILFWIVIPKKGLSQTAVSLSALSSRSYHPPSEAKVSWQRLLLQLSSIYFHVVREAQVDLDNSLFYASRSLGLSRLAVIAEGIDDPELLAQSQWVDQNNPGKGISLLAQATGKKHIELLVLLAAYYAFQPDSYHRYRDSVEYFVTRASYESKIINEKPLGRQALCLLGKMYVLGNDVVKGDSVFSSLIKDCRMAGDKKTEARAFAYRGLYAAYSPATTQNKIQLLQKAADIYSELNDAEAEINVLMNMGYLQVSVLDLEKARQSFLKALQLEEFIRFPYTHYTTGALAMTTEFQNKFGEPFKYILETIKTAEFNRDSIGWPYFYTRLGSLYFMEGGRMEESLKWTQKALDRLMLDNNEPGLYLNVANMANMLHVEGRYQEALALVLSVAKKRPAKNDRDLLYYHKALSACYSFLNQPALAEMHAVRASAMQKKTEALMGLFRRAEIIFMFAANYFRNGQYAKSKVYFEKYFLDSSKVSSLLLTDIDAYCSMIYIDSIFNDPVSAVKHYKQYTKLLDSNFRVTKLRQAEELRVKYLTEEKEHQISLLNQQAKLEQANIKQTTLVKNVTIAGIIGVLIIAGLLYRQNRFKQRVNEVISYKNELLQQLLTKKEWLLKEVHHRVKNNLNTVICLLESQAAYLENDAREANEISRRRIHAISLMHQKIYQSEDIKSIDMSVYLPELIQSLEDSFGNNRQIQSRVQIDPVQLDISQALPVALIINEAITNSIKYAFPGNEQGIVEISMYKAGDEITLSIADNGIGIDSSLLNGVSDSLGLQLIKGLSKDLKAHLHFENINGTRIIIVFNLHPINRSSYALSVMQGDEVYV